MDELNDKLRKSRQVITHKEAPAYFNYDVSPETIIRYIKHEGLPATQGGFTLFPCLSSSPGSWGRRNEHFKNTQRIFRFGLEMKTEWAFFGIKHFVKAQKQRITVIYSGKRLRKWLLLREYLLSCGQNSYQIKNYEEILQKIDGSNKRYCW